MGNNIENLPEKWKIYSLQELIDNNIILGHLDGNHGSLYPRKEEFIDKGVPYISANCIEGDSISFEKAKYLSFERAKQFKKGVAKNRDVLFAHNATVGPVALLDIEEDFIILGTSLTYYRCNEEFLKPEYLKHYLNSQIFENQYLEVMGQATRNQVPITKQRTFFHIVPPLPEQQRIVGKLNGLFENIDQAIGLLKENIAHTEALMGSVLDEIFSNGNIKLKEVCIIGPKKSEVREMEDDLEVSFLPMKDLNEHNINFNSMESKKISEVYKGYTYFADGDIILAKVTPCFENGKAGLAKSLLNGIGFGSSEYHILRPKESVLPEWIYFAVLTEQFRVTGKENMTGTGGLKRVPRPFLEEWKIPVPEISIQRKKTKRIVQTQERTKQLKSSIEIKLNQLKALKSSLLDQAFKGEL
tara:strand:+ start:879 stop:2120 length:1242 start_codon:yes stop_codon:yes gene_type:complete